MRPDKQDNVIQICSNIAPGGWKATIKRQRERAGDISVNKPALPPVLDESQMSLLTLYVLQVC
jgi:hypothetical protein